MRLRIDGVEVPLLNKRVKLPSYDSRKLRGCAMQREGDVVRLEVEVTDATMKLFGFASEAHTESRFNDSYHHGELSVDGVVLLSGVVSYLSTKRQAGNGSYNIELRVGGATWADMAASTKLKNSDIKANRRLDLSTIEQSWSDDNPVKFLPIHRDSYPQPASTGLYEVYSPLLPQDYHPFISVKALINSIVKRAGYTLHSNFLNTPFFEKLMLSGAYKGVASGEAYASMGFKAVRSVSSTATADDLGRVDAWVPQSSRNIGAFVDTVSATTIDENGNPCMDAYTNGGCFSFDTERPIFRPRREVNVAFDLHFDYTTAYTIRSSKWLQGFTKIYVGNGCSIDVALPNPHLDRRDSVSTRLQYKLYIFDYDPTASYRLSDVGDVHGRVSTVLFESLSSPQVQLYIKRAGDVAYSKYEGDWALYDGYVAEQGEQRVEFTLRTPYEHCTPSSPKIFNDIYFEGAAPGQQLCLHAGCSITPVFGDTAGYGESLTFEDVANHDITQAAIIDALVQMFNLCIYTHRPSQSIFIEPYDNFFSGAEVDWREKERGEQSLYEEGVVESFMLTELGYQPSDGAVGYGYDQSSGEFGSWRYMVSSYATKQSVERIVNPIFSPTASYANLVGTAPSAELLTVGDRDIIVEAESIEPRIVLYHGLRMLPVGEHWPSPLTTDSYPLASFHSPDEQCTLCFEDRDGVMGLHRYYDKELGERATRQILTTDIYLPPEQYATLLDPQSENGNLRSRFRLNIGGSSALFRLDAIEEYDTSTHLARCRFRRLFIE